METDKEKIDRTSFSLRGIGEIAQHLSSKQTEILVQHMLSGEDAKIEEPQETKEEPKKPLKAKIVSTIFPEGISVFSKKMDFGNNHPQNHAK